MRQFAVNTESMISTYKISKKQIDLLSEAINRMEVSVRELNATWKGSNSSAFSQEFNESCKHMKGLVSVLVQFVETYSNAAKTYESCESEVSRLAAY